VKGGIFSKSYITYLVKTFPLEFKVCRRYSDFLWLRQILVREYPSYNIPPMCKKSGVSSSDMEGIHKRMHQLQFFIDGIIAHPELRSSQHFLVFLKMSNLDQFTKTRDSLEAKMTPISGIRENFAKAMAPGSKFSTSLFPSMEGQLSLKISPKLKEFSIHSEELFKQLIPINIR